MSAPNVTTRNFGWRYDVQEGTGYPTSNVANGQWYRGVLYRAAQPAFQLPPYNAMLDRSAATPAATRKRGRRGRR